MSFLVIQRHCSERTAVPARRLLESSGFDVESVQVGAFEATLKQALQVSADWHGQWSLHVDGDVVLDASALSQIWEVFSSNFEDQKPAVSIFKVLDKSTGNNRFVGVRLYERQFARRLLKHLYLSAGHQRPETRAITSQLCSSDKIAKFGRVIGIHDYFQHPVDLARTGWQYARKMPNWNFSVLNEWRTKAEHDIEFRALLEGALASFRSLDLLHLDRSKVDPFLTPILEELDIRPRTESLGDEFFKSGCGAALLSSAVATKPLFKDHISQSFKTGLTSSRISRRKALVADILTAYGIGAGYRGLVELAVGNQRASSQNGIHDMVRFLNS